MREMGRCSGREVLYLYTERGSGAEQLYKRLGWQIMGHDHYDGIAVSVMRKHLDQVGS